MIFIDGDNFITDEEQESAGSEIETPYRDWAIDFSTGKLALRGGKNYVVEDADAIKVWIWKTLKTKKGVFPAYDEEYGAELDELIGESDVGVIAELAAFYLEEALTQSPYINGVSNATVERRADKAIISFTVNTIWGDVQEETELEYI